jgi:hypothetical protein
MYLYLFLTQYIVSVLYWKIKKNQYYTNMLYLVTNTAQCKNNAILFFLYCPFGLLNTVQID